MDEWMKKKKKAVFADLWEISDEDSPIIFLICS